MSKGMGGALAHPGNCERETQKIGGSRVQARVKVSRKQRGNLAVQTKEALQEMAELRLEKDKVVLGLQASHSYRCTLCCAARSQLSA